MILHRRKLLTAGAGLATLTAAGARPAAPVLACP